MRILNRLVFLILLSSGLALAVQPALSAPIISQDRELASTAEGAEHRAGIQALLANDYAAAQAAFERALALQAGHAPALIGLAAVAQAKGAQPEAARYLREAMTHSPLAPEVHLAWGRYHLGVNDAGSAETSFLSAKRLAPRQVPPLLELGDLYLNLPGRAADALQAFEDALALTPDNAFAQYGKGVAAAATGQRELALGALARAAELEPRDPAPHRAIGLLHMETNALALALAAFDAGLARQPGYGLLLLDRADALGRMARWDATIEQLEAAEALFPQEAAIKTKMGDAYQGSGRWQEAEASYAAAMRLQPGNPLAYNNLAWMLVESGGDLQKAVSLAQEAVRLSPGSSPFHDTLGWAERAAGNPAGAAQSFTRAIELEPEVAGYHFHLGLVQSELQQASAARASLTRALELDPGLPEAAQARELLAALGQ